MSETTESIPLIVGYVEGLRLWNILKMHSVHLRSAISTSEAMTVCGSRQSVPAPSIRRELRTLLFGSSSVRTKLACARSITADGI